MKAREISKGIIVNLMLECADAAVYDWMKSSGTRKRFVKKSGAFA